jgi:hypothetical protein
MQVYFLAVLALILSVAVAQEDCIKGTNTNFTKITPICRPTYNITANSTGAAGVELSSLFSSIHPTPACAQAFAEYHCSINYQTCDNATQPCQQTCNKVLDSCSVNDTLLFNGASLPLPTQAECDELQADNSTACSTPSGTDLTNYYDSCAVPNLNRMARDGNTTVICYIKHEATIRNVSYSLGYDVWLALRGFAMSLGAGMNDSVESCFIHYSSFYCGQAFPPCTPALDPKNQKPICKSACIKLQESCAGVSQYFQPGEFPPLSVCNGLPTTDCFEPNPSDINLDYFSFHAPTVIPTDPPVESSDYDDDGIIYPPGGPGKGAGIGVGVLFGLLLIIVGLTLIMKKQEN